MENKSTFLEISDNLKKLIKKKEKMEQDYKTVCEDIEQTKKALIEASENI